MELTMKRFGLARRERLIRKRDYDAAYAARCSTADKHLILYARSNGLAWSRIGRSVAKRWGTAVARNRFRRTCHEAFRQHKHEIPVGYDYIIIPRRSIALSLEDVAESLKTLANKLAKRDT